MKNTSLRKNASVSFAIKKFHHILGLYITNKCNFLCAHCGVNSGPREKSHLAIEIIIPKIREIANSTDIKTIHISGGEPFLFQNDLKTISQVCHEKGLSLAINTNGFWAVKPDRARKLFASMPSLSEIILSSDVYHEKFLDLKLLRKAAEIALEFDLLVNVHLCLAPNTESDFPDRLKKVFGKNLLSRIILTDTTLERGGRADKLLEAFWRKRTDEYPSSPCYLLNRPVIMENLDVQACCNTTVAEACKNSPLNLGNLETTSLNTLLAKAKNDTLLQTIRLLGPAYLAKNLSKKEQKQLSGKYLEGLNCTLCVDLMSRSELEPSLRRISQSKKSRQKVRLISNLLNE